jgi:Tfp pilus assembly protein PilX
VFILHTPENAYQIATCSVTYSATYKHTVHTTKFNGAETTSGFIGLQATTHNTVVSNRGRKTTAEVWRVTTRNVAHDAQTLIPRVVLPTHPHE